MGNKVYLADKLTGSFCIVVHTDGKCEVKQLKSPQTAFAEAKDFIGCRFLDHVRVQKVADDVYIEYLVDDEGYIHWQDDPKQVNQLATYIYNGGDKPGHYILGNVVFCLSVYKEEDGWDFCGMSEEFANHIAQCTGRDLLLKAKEACPIPERVPDPVVKIKTYENKEDVIKALQGDKTVKPTSETILSGEKPHAAAEG